MPQAQPEDLLAACQPSVDTSYSNSRAHERAPHNIPGDADGNGAFHDQTKSQVQYPVAEIEARDIATSAVPS